MRKSDLWFLVVLVAVIALTMRSLETNELRESGSLQSGVLSKISLELSPVLRQEALTQRPGFTMAGFAIGDRVESELIPSSSCLDYGWFETEVDGEQIEIQISGKFGATLITGGPLSLDSEQILSAEPSLLECLNTLGDPDFCEAIPNCITCNSGPEWKRGDYIIRYYLNERQLTLGSSRSYTHYSSFSDFPNAP